ncbi:hypothetical protein JXD38_10815, partial [candidate division WOR-3 bacterium]|nr:hypothetical protein [candidate division WOR-3 bacterium]
MKVITPAICFCLLSTAVGSGPDTLWVSRLDLGANEVGNGIASRGNAVAVVGATSANPSTDVLVARLDQDGDTLWTRTFGDTSLNEMAVSACIDAESNILVCGYGASYSRALASRLFRPGYDGRTAGGQPSDLLVYAVTAKYDSAGEFKWLRVDTNCMALGVAVDSAGNSYVSGAFYDGNYFDLGLAKVDPSGDTLWARTYDFEPFEIAYRTALDPWGNIVMCAYVSDGENFDCLTLKLTPDGDTIWTRRYDHSPDDACCGIAVDRNGNVFVAGRVVKDSTSDALVLKYDSGGALVWNGIHDFDMVDIGLGVACDSAGDVFLTGCTGADNVYDWLVMKLDSAGNRLWTTTYGGPYDDEASDVALDEADNPIVAGFVTDTLTLTLDLVAIKYSSLTGVAEESPHVETRMPSATTIVYDVLSLPDDRGPVTGDLAALLDMAGRTVIGLRPGANDLSHLSPGV